MCAAIVGLALAALSAPASAAAQRSFRGQLELDFTIADRGVATYTTMHYELEAELAIARDGAARLHVTGALDRRVATLVPPGAVREQPPVHLAVDETHTGRVISDDARAIVIRLDPDVRGTVLEWRCERAREPVAGRDRDLLRCAISTPYTGLPWNDPAPAYLRATMVLARDGDVRAHVTADQDHGSHATLSARRAHAR